MDDFADVCKAEVFGHLLIRDKETGEILVNQRETLIVPKEQEDEE
jgi:hypothetical protein